MGKWVEPRPRPGVEAAALMTGSSSGADAMPASGSAGGQSWEQNKLLFNEATPTAFPGGAEWEFNSGWVWVWGGCSPCSVGAGVWVEAGMEK